MLSLGASLMVFQSYAQTIPTTKSDMASLDGSLAGSPSIKLVKVAEGFEDPVNIATANDGSNRLFVVERAGRVRVLLESGAVEQKPFLDLTTLKPSTINPAGNDVLSEFIEQGLLSIAFHPNYSKNGFFFVHYTSVSANGASSITRFQIDPSSPNHVSPEQARKTEKLILQVPQPSYNNNGGQIAFGPDGFLYISLGDGGFNSPENASQELSNRLGKILRIDVDDAGPYSAPSDNPFASAGGTPQDEIWAYGFHNPYKFAFDEKTGGMFIADVGDSSVEEINYVPNSKNGLNFGWPRMEGSGCYSAQVGVKVECEPIGVLPVAEYRHPPKTDSSDPNTGAFACASVQGLGVANNPPFNGVFMFGDWCSGDIFGIGWEAGKWKGQKLTSTDLHITSGGVGESGDIYVLSAKFYFDDPDTDKPPFGTVWRIVAQ